MGPRTLHGPKGLLLQGCPVFHLMGTNCEAEEQVYVP
jgi:hypothetical protein